MRGPARLSPKRVKYIYVSRLCYLLIFVAGIFGMLRYIFIIYLSVISHECSHLLACFKLGVKTESISFFPYGANVKLNSVVPPCKQIIISISGPFCSFVLYILGKLMSKFFASEFTTYFTTINLTLFVFNMLPCIPLDGGEIIRSIISLKSGIINSYKIMTYISFVFELIFLISGFVLCVTTGGNITLIIISAIILTNILKCRNSVIHITGKILTQGIKSDKKIKLIVKHKNENMYTVIKNISFGYTLIIAIYDGERYIGFVTQKDVLDNINFCQTFGECVEKL